MNNLVIWFYTYQIIDKAKSSKKPIILVTSEKKKDWWRKIKGQTIGPKPELIEEMQDKANVQFICTVLINSCVSLRND